MSPPASPPPREIVHVDKATGVKTSFGIVMQQREVGAWSVTLSWVEDDDIWWITSQHPTRATQQAGFVAKIYPSRREDSWGYFYGLTEHDLDHPEPYDGPTS